MTYIPWSSDFALYLEDYLMHEHYYWDMSQYDPKFYLKMNIGHCTYILWSSDFALHLEGYLMYEHHTLGLRVSMT